MTGLSPAPALPIGGAATRLPHAPHSSRGLRSILVLGGLAAGLWLLGLLLGSSHADAKPQRPTPVPLVQQLDRTTAQALGTAQRAVTSVASPVEKTARALRRAVSSVATPITTSVTHTVTRSLPVLTGALPHRAVGRTVVRVVHHARVVPTSGRAAPAPAAAPVASPARVAGHRHAAATSVHVNRSGHAALGPTTPVAPGPVDPAPAQPTPADPSAPAMSATPDLSALPLLPVRPAAGSVPAPAANAVMVTGLRAAEPSFSPD